MARPRKAGKRELMTIVVKGGRIAKVMIVRQDLPCRPLADISLVEAVEHGPTRTTIADDVATMLKNRPIAFPKILVGAGI